MSGTPVSFHEGVGQDVRSGDWRAQCASTYDLFATAVRADRLSDAAALARYVPQEGQEAVDLFTEWLPMIRDYMRQAGVPAEVIAERERAAVAKVETGRTRPIDAMKEWKRVCQLAESAAELCVRGTPEDAIATLEQSRDTWLDVHDRLCDHIQAMIGLVAALVGEKHIGELWQLLMAPMIDSYGRYDIAHTPWDRSAEVLLYVTAEALRGHLSGPGRRGTVELIEEVDRIGYRFEPCGSGGRNITQETYDTYPVTTERHDWAWNLEGVCLYCAHCCVLSEVNPIRRLGYPAREVEPPFENSSGRRDFCTWWVYKDPALVPAHVYERTGHTKPATIGNAARKSARKTD